MAAEHTDALAAATSGLKDCKAVNANTASSAPAINSKTLVLHRLTAELTYRRPGRVSRVAELKAVTTVGSGDWLGRAINDIQIKWL